MKKISLTFCLALLSSLFCPAQVSPLQFNKNGEFKIVQFTDIHFKYGNPASDIALKRIGEVLDAFENVYKHECHVSSLIDELVNVASSEKDKASQDFLWGYVREQVEEEATALGIVEKLKRCKDEASILYMDEKLGER